MSLWFQPKPRSVLYCDFTGFRVPEMTKRRPVIVLRAHKQNRRLVYVVPLSTTPPVPARPYHFHFAHSPVLRDQPTEAWAKCDMVAVVSIDRLSVIGHRDNARPSRGMLRISESDFAAIRRCVAIAFGFGSGSYVHEDAGATCVTPVDVE